MKMKKLLSIGAIGLALACSTSIGASAAEKPTNEKIKTDMIKLFLEDKSPLTYDVTSSTTVGDVVNISKLQQDLKKYGFGEYPEGWPGQTYDTLNEALSLVESDKTAIYNAKKIATVLLQEDKFDDLLSEVRAMATVLRDIENSSSDHDSEKFQIENDIKDLIKDSNPDLDVSFGKNIDGKLTMTILKGNQIILQLNSGNAYTISETLKNDADKLESYAGLFGLISVKE